MQHPFWSEAADSLHFEYLDGAVTPVEPGFATGVRTLPYFVIAQVTSGAVAMEIANAPARLVAPGEALCVAPGITHQMVDRSGRANVSRWCHVNFHLMGTLDVAALMDLTQVISAPLSERVGTICATLAQWNAGSGSGDPSFAALLHQRALGLELLSLLLEATPPEPPRARRWRELTQILPVLEEVAAHPERAWSREEMARLVHLSPSRFAAVFSKAMGQAPAAYARNQQLKRASHLLISTSLSVEQIARQCGFGGPAQLGHHFRRHFGRSPANYRKVDASYPGF